MILPKQSLLGKVECYYSNQKKYLKAKAWHDHGHENNPNVPRWEDTRKSSGFNFRMTEMQGAVGLAQLKKLDYIIKKQRENHNKIWNNIKNLNILKEPIQTNVKYQQMH